MKDVRRVPKLLAKKSPIQGAKRLHARPKVRCAERAVMPLAAASLV